MMRHGVPFEQAVYGSFPFWDRGYAVLAQSPGCRPEWLTALRAACQRYGERPAGAAAAGGLFALRLPRGPWMIVGPSEQGCDDQGRPGALAFHGLFIHPWHYLWAGCDPFAFAGALATRWGPNTRALPVGRCALGPTAETDAADDPRAGAIVDALVRRRPLVLEADGPIDALARQVWRALPRSARRRATVATWAFRPMPGFDLLTVPRRRA